MRKLFVVATIIALSISASANEMASRALQSGSPTGDRPLHQAGIAGQGEIVAVLDTGLDWDSCYFAEPDHSPPPVNTINPDGSLETANVDLARRKVVAYDFLYSCDEYPTAPGCDSPLRPGDWDNQGHGTLAAGAIAADRDEPITANTGDAIAPGAKLVIQDAGYIGGDFCSQRPGLGCPVRDLREVLAQAYAQGARIHSNSWGDRQGAGATQIPPTANYNDWTAQIDQFVHEHPDMVVVFNTGNAGQLGASSLSSPGSAKNTIQVGGFTWADGQGAVLWWSGSGPTRDGRLKPDLVAPAFVALPTNDGDVTTDNCGRVTEGGTSWSGPVVAGAAALVRQYYRDVRAISAPSSALVKATLIASARPLHLEIPPNGTTARRIPAEPSMDQGFGMPVLDDVLPLAGDQESLWFRDIDGLVIEDRPVSFRFDVQGGMRLKVVLAWIDPPGAGSEIPASQPRLVNDLDLVIEGPSGAMRFGNDVLGATPDRLNNVEAVTIDDVEPGRYTVTIAPHAIRHGGSQRAALVVSGSLTPVGEPSRRRAVTRP